MRLSILFVALASVLTAADVNTSCAAEVRIWKDTSGKFQVRAELIEKTETVVKLKKDDGREISVPIQRLSKLDRDYLEALNVPTDDPFAGGTKPDSKPTSSGRIAAPAGTLASLPDSNSVGEEMALAGTGNTIDLSASPLDKPFVPDPLTQVPSVVSAVAPVTPVDAYDRVSVPVLASSNGDFFVSIGRNKAGSPQETRGRIYITSLAKKTSNLVWDFPNSVLVLGHDAPSGRTLIADKLDIFGRGGELVMLEGLASGKPKVLYRRILPGAGKPGFAPMVEWARLLSRSHAAVIVDGVFHLWDLPAAKLLYRIEQVKSAEPPALSGNDVYMAIPQSGKVVVIETATGAIRASLPTGTTLSPGAAFHPDGQQLAVAFSNQYQVWDCVAGKIVSEATTTDHLSSHPIHWIDPKMFRTSLGDVVDVELGMSVWKYYLSSTTQPIAFGNKLVIATTGQNCSLVSVQVPHATVQKSVKQLASAGDKAMLVRPGSAVAFSIESTAGAVDEAAIKGSLEAAAQKAGWKISPSAPVTLVAKIGRGETQQLQFQSLGVGPRTNSTASLTPFTAELEIRRGSNVLWSRKTTNHVPSILHLKEGQTVQDAVKQFEKPDAGFFSLLTLPPRIPKPEISAQIGMSTLENGVWQDLNTKPAAPTPRRR